MHMFQHVLCGILHKKRSIHFYVKHHNFEKIVFKIEKKIVKIRQKQLKNRFNSQEIYSEATVFVQKHI